MLDATRSATIAMDAVTVSPISAALLAGVRGHGFARRGMGTRGAQFTGDRRHGNNAYAKTACGKERDKLLKANHEHLPRLPRR